MCSPRQEYAILKQFHYKHSLCSSFSAPKRSLVSVVRFLKCKNAADIFKKPEERSDRSKYERSIHFPFLQRNLEVGVNYWPRYEARLKKKLDVRNRKTVEKKMEDVRLNSTEAGCSSQERQEEQEEMGRSYYVEEPESEHDHERENIRLHTTDTEIDVVTHPTRHKPRMKRWANTIVLTDSSVMNPPSPNASFETVQSLPDYSPIKKSQQYLEPQTPTNLSNTLPLTSTPAVQPKETPVFVRRLRSDAQKRMASSLEPPPWKKNKKSRYN